MSREETDGAALANTTDEALDVRRRASDDAST